MREHIEFIQAQRLPWEDAAGVGFAGGRMKMLSRDDVDGSFSAVLSLPKGWSRAAGPADHDEEMFTLDGALGVGPARLEDNTYRFVAAGSAENSLAAPEDVVLLYFRSGEIEAPRRAPAAAARRSVAPIDLWAGSWDGDFDKLGLGELKSRSRMRILREDPDSGETTYVSASAAFKRGERAERHPIVQEFYMLSGELSGEQGTMHAGAYCFRPPMFKHAPYFSPTGAVILFRGLGGRQETFWDEAPALGRHPPHAPILPDRLKPLGGPYPRPSRY